MGLQDHVPSLRCCYDDPTAAAATAATATAATVAVTTMAVGRALVADSRCTVPTLHPPWTMRQTWKWVVFTELVLQTLGCMDIHLGQAEDTVLVYHLQKNLHYRPQGLADGNWALETLGCCRLQYPPIHWRPLLRWGQLEGLLLALPDGYECVATGGPQVVFVLSIVLLPLPCSSAELGVLKLTTVVTVKQATTELEHRGSVRMIAIHG